MDQLETSTILNEAFCKLPYSNTTNSVNNTARYNLQKAQILGDARKFNNSDQSPTFNTEPSYPNKPVKAPNTSKNQPFPNSPIFALNLSKKNLSTPPKNILDHVSSLCIIDLSYNKFTDFPNEILSLANLKTLKLDHNFLKKLPQDLNQLAQLENFSISNNYLLSLPKSISSMKTIAILNLSRNQIDELPKEIADLTSLRLLYLNNNHFNSIPSNLNNLIHLREICLEWFKYTNPPLSPIQNDKNRFIILKVFELCKSHQSLKKAEITFDDFISYFSPGNFNLLLIRDSHFRNLLHITVLEEEFGIVKHLLNTKPSLMNELDQDQQTPLSLAIREEKYMISRLLLLHGVDPKVGGGVFGSSLHMATTKFQLSLVKDLLKNGANPNVQDQDGNTPLHLLFSIFSKDLEQSVELAQTLMEHGTYPNVKNKDLWAPIHCAIRRGHVEAVKWVLNYNSTLKTDDNKYFDVNLKGGAEKWTPLHLASSLGMIDIISMLIDVNVDMMERTKNGKTARDVCASNLIMSKMMKKFETNWMQRHLFKPASLDNKLKEISLNSDVSKLKSMINLSTVKTFKLMKSSNTTEPMNKFFASNNKFSKLPSNLVDEDDTSNSPCPSMPLDNNVDNKSLSEISSKRPKSANGQSGDESILIGDFDEAVAKETFEKNAMRVIPRSPNNIQKLQIAQNYRNYMTSQLNHLNLQKSVNSSANLKNQFAGAFISSNERNHSSSAQFSTMKKIAAVHSNQTNLNFHEPSSSSLQKYQSALASAGQKSQSVNISVSISKPFVETPEFHGYIRNFEGYVDEIKKFQNYIMDREQGLSERLKYLFYMKLFHMKINQQYHKIHSELMPFEVFIILEYIEDEFRKEKALSMTRINNNNDLVPRSLLFIFESLDSTCSYSNALLKNEICYIFGQFRFRTAKHFLDQILNNRKDSRLVREECAMTRNILENLPATQVLSPKVIMGSQPKIIQNHRGSMSRTSSVSQSVSKESDFVVLDSLKNKFKNTSAQRKAIPSKVTQLQAQIQQIHTQKSVMFNGDRLKRDSVSKDENIIDEDSSRKNISKIMEGRKNKKEYDMKNDYILDELDPKYANRESNKTELTRALSRSMIGDESMIKHVEEHPPSKRLGVANYFQSS